MNLLHTLDLRARVGHALTRFGQELALLLAWLGVLTYVSYSGWQARQEAMARSEETIEEALADPANRARIGEALKEKGP